MGKSRHIFSFQAWQEPAVKKGYKTTTIRQNRKRMPKVGDIAVLATGLRTKDYRVWGEAKIVRVEGFDKWANSINCDWNKLALTENYGNPFNLGYFFGKQYGRKFKNCPLLPSHLFFITEWGKLNK